MEGNFAGDLPSKVDFRASRLQSGALRALRALFLPIQTLPTVSVIDFPPFSQPS